MMKSAPTLAVSRNLQVLLLVVLGCTVGCRNPGAPAILVPKKIVDLSPAITEDLPVRQLGHRACSFLGLSERLAFTPVVPAKPEYTFGLTSVCLPTNIGAHVDAPGRLLKDGARADQLPLEKFYGRAHVVDLRWADRHNPIQITQLEDAKIEADEILILFMGYAEPKGDDWPTYAPLSEDAAKWIASKKIRALATDAPSIGNFHRYADLMDKGRPPEDVWAERLAFESPNPKDSIPVIQGLANLDQIFEEKNVVFVGFPLAVADRSGAPLRAVALVY